MFKRYLEDVVFLSEFGRQMRFIVGPRQTGKTTLAKKFIHKKDGQYYNWDTRVVKDQYVKNPYFFHDQILSQSKHGTKKWICLDEIHKMPKWKNILKDYFDTFESRYKFIITGSARLDFFRKSGDSLAGRYFTFRLNPLTLAETIGIQKPLSMPNDACDFIIRQLDKPVYEQDALENLLTFSGFPEPLEKSSKTFHARWRKNYMDRLVREDMRDLTKIANLENIFLLMQLLPERIGSLLSINALAHDTQIGYKAVKNLVYALELLCVVFIIRPWHQRINRSIRKEPKLYFFDWTQIKSADKVFENYVALELKNRANLWTDRGWGDFDLHFIRTKDGKETDFLITHNMQPWLLCEVKLSCGHIESHHHRTSAKLGNIPFVQIVKEKNIAQERPNNFYQISASRFFSNIY